MTGRRPSVHEPPLLVSGRSATQCWNPPGSHRIGRPPISTVGLGHSAVFLAELSAESPDGKKPSGKLHWRTIHAPKLRYASRRVEREGGLLLHELGVAGDNPSIAVSGLSQASLVRCVAPGELGHDAITSDDEGNWARSTRIGVELRLDMHLSVVGVEDHQHGVALSDRFAHGRNGGGVNGTALHQRNAFGQLVRRDSSAVVLADVRLPLTLSAATAK
jgi:hypothetical protein